MKVSVVITNAARDAIIRQADPLKGYDARQDKRLPDGTWQVLIDQEVYTRLLRLSAEVGGASLSDTILWISTIKH